MTIPPYFDALIASFHRGATGRCVHLGYWDEPQCNDANHAIGEFLVAQRRLDEVLISMADLHDGQSILDVGCGFGGTLEWIDRQFARMLLTGVNIDSRQLDICRQLSPTHDNHFNWEQADACKLPFSANQFDRIFCVEAMFHFGSRRDFFLEAARVLVPGGTLVCSDINIMASALTVDLPGFCIEAPLQDGYGPWPDFWSEDADHGVLSRFAGLVCSSTKDLTANTLPSYRYTSSSSADESRDPGTVSERAALMLQWLHRHGHLRYQCFRFDKPAEKSP